MLQNPREAAVVSDRQAVSSHLLVRPMPPAERLVFGPLVHLDHLQAGARPAQYGYPDYRKRVASHLQHSPSKLSRQCMTRGPDARPAALFVAAYQEVPGAEPEDATRRRQCGAMERPAGPLRRPDSPLSVLSALTWRRRRPLRSRQASTFSLREERAPARSRAPNPPLPPRSRPSSCTVASGRTPAAARVMVSSWSCRPPQTRRCSDTLTPAGPAGVRSGVR